MKKIGTFQELILGQYPSNLVYGIKYIEHIYVNLIEISPVVKEIRGIENDKLAVSVNNTFVHHTTFLATDT